MFPLPCVFSRVLVAVVLALPTVVVAQDAKPKRPNVLFIFTDDHAYHAISAYGSKINKTPNMDRIAREGMRFDRCLVTNSICGPSRAVILTGKYSHKNGFYRNGNRFDGGQMTFPKILQKNGYATAMIGKWHLSSDPTGFDYWQVLRGQGPYYNPNMKSSDGPVKHIGYTTDIVTDLSLKWLKTDRDKNKPFMLMLQHKAPHRNWQPGPKYLTKYDGETIPEPPTLFDDYAGRAKVAAKQTMTVANHLNKNDLKLTGQRGLTPEQRKVWDAAYGPKNEAFEKANLEGKAFVKWKYQRYIKDYLRCVASVDDNIGRSAGLPRRVGPRGEHGRHLLVGPRAGTSVTTVGTTSGGCTTSRCECRSSSAGRASSTPGTTNKDLISNVDFAETFLDIAGCGDQIPADMQGRSIVPILKGQTPADWRKSFYYHYYEFPGPHSVAKHYGVRTDRHKLIHYYRENEWELFDLQSDPDELRSVYDNPDYADVVKRLKLEIKAKQVELDETKPHKPVPGDPELRPKRRGPRRGAQRKPMKVFVLAGQSNMQGKGVPAHLEKMIAADAKDARLQGLKKGDTWVERDDVWITYKRGGKAKGQAAHPKGGLTIGYGGNPKQIGPEFGFGHAVGKHFDEQVLIIKCAWGGVAVKKGFLPPGAGGPGDKYTEMITDIKDALGNLKEWFPKYRKRAGYELAGLVWFQGWNDSVGGGNPKYTEQLAQLIRDVRKDLGVPKLPVVIGELGQAGANPKGKVIKFRTQQEAVAKLAEFQGTVRYVKTGIYVDPRLPELFAVWRKSKGAAGKAKKQKLGKPAEEAAWAPWKTHEAEWKSIAGDRPYHYFGSGRTFFLMGDAFGRAMIDLTK